MKEDPYFDVLPKKKNQKLVLPKQCLCITKIKKTLQNGITSMHLFVIVFSWLITTFAYYWVLLVNRERRYVISICIETKIDQKYIS